MKAFSIILLLIIPIAIPAQQPPQPCKAVYDIAFMERLSHERITSRENLSLASNNFDVKYYRCEWEVDPASYFIKGKVTVYFVMTSAGNSISLDLMNSLTVDSIKQRGT